MILNDMTDFDKLIKEKAEKASYPYDEAAWKQFKRKAGMPGKAAKYWVMGASAVMVAGGLLLLKPGRQGQPLQDNPSTTTVAAPDSSMVSQNPSDLVSEDTLTLSSENVTGKKPIQVSHRQTEPLEANTVQIKKDTPKVSRKVIYGRPLVIDVDTITRMVPTDEELEKGHSRLY